MTADNNRRARSALIALALTLVMALTWAFAGAARAQDRDPTANAPVVVELFTSQGCSSCPPADRLLGELAARGDVIALSLPVDYWDYLDWEDTLGRAEHTSRQHTYAKYLGLPNVYTPQMVINGRFDVVGSRTRAVEDAIRKARSEPAGAYVPISIEPRGDQIIVEVGAAPRPGDDARASILVMPLLSASTVAIKRGENRGKTITYHNVSREIMEVGAWDGEARTLSLAHDEVMIGDTDRCAVILQDEESGAILGAALL